MISQSEKYVLLSVPFIQEGEAVGTPIYLALQSALKKGVDVDIVSTLSGLEVVQERILGIVQEGSYVTFGPK